MRALPAESKRALRSLPDASLATGTSRLFGTPSVTWVPVPLRVDDSLSAVRRKVSKAVGLADERQVYIWSVDSGSIRADTSVFAQEVVAQVFGATRETVTKIELLAAAGLLLADATQRATLMKHIAPSSQHDALTAWQAVAFLEQAVKRHRIEAVARPLDFRYSLEDSEVYLTADPFAPDALAVDANMVAGDGGARRAYNVVSLDGITLESAGDRLQLHACVASDVIEYVRAALKLNEASPSDALRMRMYVNGFVRKYFPFVPDEFTSTSALAVTKVDPKDDTDRRLCARLAGQIAKEAQLRALEDVAARMRADGTAYTDATSWSYVQVRGNESNCNQGVDLANLFEMFHVSSGVPLLIYFDGIGTMYKLYTPDVLSGALPESRVASWIQKKPQQRQDVPYVQLVVRIASSGADVKNAPDVEQQFGKVIFWADMSYEMRLGFSALRAADDGVLTRALASLDASAIRPMRAMFGGRLVHVPSPDLEFVSESRNGVNARLNNAVVCMTIRAPLARMPGLSRIAAAARAHMLPLFEVLHVGASQLLLRVRRVDSMARRQTMDDAIYAMQDQPREAVVEMLTSAFGLTDAEAEARFDEWMADFAMDMELGHGAMGGPLGRRRSSGSSGPSGSMTPALILPTLARAGSTHRGGAMMVRMFAPSQNVGIKVLVEGAAHAALVKRVSTSLLALVAVAGKWSGASPKAVAKSTMNANADDSDQSDDVSNAHRNSNTDSTDRDNDDDAVNNTDNTDNNNTDNNNTDNNNTDLDFADVNQQLEAELEALVGVGATQDTTPTAEQATQNVTQKVTSNDDDNDGEGDHDAEDDGTTAAGNKQILNRLYKADPELFQVKLANGSRYSSVCGKVDARQPIVISQADKAKIDATTPGSYEGYVRAGSSKARADANMYICPDVWCPKSRLSMTAEQFRKNGGKCPDASVNETPIVLHAKYWDGREKKYPGFLEARHHPQGLCMPCCFRRPAHKTKECAVARPDLFSAVSGQASDDKSDGSSEDDDGDATSSRYIRGNVFPLGKDMFGLLPASAHAFFANKRCGNRDDGSGQVVASTSCYVRRGIDNTPQSFLSAATHVLGFADHAELLARMRRGLGMTAFLELSGGAVAKEFMPTFPNFKDAGKAAAFAKWLPTQGEYVKQFRLKDIVRDVAQAQRRGAAAVVKLLMDDVAACREYVLYDALQRYMSYLDSDRVVKTHAAGVLDLLNGSEAANPRRVNFLVIEGDPSTGKAYVHASLTAASRMRLDRPFAVLVKQGAFYEPLYKLHVTRGALSTDRLLTYGSCPPLRSIVDALLTWTTSSALTGQTPGRTEEEEEEQGAEAAADDGGWSARHVGWNGLVRVLAALGSTVETQVVDYRFLVVAVVVSGGVLVPLQRATSLLPDRRLSVEYVGDVVRRLRVPTKRTGAVVRLFEQLAYVLDDDSYRVRDVVRRASSTSTAHLVLRGGFVVPFDGLASMDASASVAYLDNLNIVLGIQKPDARTAFVGRLKSEASWLDRHLRRVAAGLLAHSAHMQEYKFLRSSQNPFPLDHRRARMLALLESMERSGLPSSVKDGGDVNFGGDAWRKLTDRLLFGADVLNASMGVEVSSRIVPQKATEFVVLTDAELIQGTLQSVLTDSVLTSVSRQRTTTRPKPTASTSSADVIIGASSMDKGTLASLRSESAATHPAETKGAPNPLSFLRRTPFAMLAGVDVFAFLALAHRAFAPSALFTAGHMKRILENRIIRDARLDARDAVRRIESSAYRADASDVRMLAEECGMNVVIFTVDPGPGHGPAGHGPAGTGDGKSKVKVKVNVKVNVKVTKGKVTKGKVTKGKVTKGKDNNKDGAGTSAESSVVSAPDVDSTIVLICRRKDASCEFDAIIGRDRKLFVTVSRSAHLASIRTMLHTAFGGS